MIENAGFADEGEHEQPESEETLTEMTPEIQAELLRLGPDIALF